MGQGKDPAFMMWGKRDGMSNGISDMAVAYNKEEQTMLANSGYKVMCTQVLI